MADKALALTLNKQLLTDTVTKCLLVCETRSSIPILSCVKISATADPEITVQATDLDKALTVTLDDDSAVVGNPGTVVIPAKQLAKTLANMKTIPDSDVTLKALDDHWVELGCGKLKVKVPGMSKAQFPVLPTPANKNWHDSANVVEVETLLEMIRRSRPAIAEEESRYTLNGARFEINRDTMRMVTTDGHRLVNISKNGGGRSDTTEVKTLISRGTLDVLVKLLAKRNYNDLEFLCDDDTTTGTAAQQYFRHENWTLSSRTMTGQFPNYNAVIPKRDRVTSTVTVDAGKLAQVVKRVGMRG